MANGTKCTVIGSLSVPIQLRDRVKICEILVIPSLAHTLILGADFWRNMGIVPDLRHGEWQFSNFADTSVEISPLLLDQTNLSDEQNFTLNQMLDKVFKNMPDTVGCAHLVEHKIITNAEPIKQRYYPVSPVIQKQIDEELDTMDATK